MKAKRAIAVAALASVITSVLTGCAGLPGANSDARPGDYASNYFSAPMSSLYPGNYPHSATATISSR